MRSRRRSIARALLVGAALLSALVGPAPAGGAPSVVRPARQLTPPPFAVVDQTAFVPADGTFELVVRWPADVSAERLDLTLFGVLEAEDDMGSTPIDVLNRRSFPLAELPRDEVGNLVVSLPIRSAPNGDAERIFVPTDGVYPVELALNGPDGRVASLDTHLIRLPSETAEIDPLPVAILMPVAAADDLTINDAIELLTEHPSIPVTVVLERGVLTQLENSPDLVGRLRSALAGRPVTAERVIRLDPSALAETDLGELWHDATAADRARFDALGLPLSDELAVNDLRLTEAGLELLAGDRELVVIDNTSTGSSSGTLRRDPRVVSVRPDPDDSRALRVHPDQVGRVHELLARLTLRAQVDRSPIILGAGSADGRVAAGPLDTVLDALSSPGPVGPVSLLEIAGDVGAIPVLPAERPSQDLRPLAETLTETLADLESYREVHVTGDPQPGRLRSELTGAVTTDRNQDDRARALDRVAQSVDEALAFVTLPDQGSVTLATERHPLPIRFESTASGTRRVRLRFESDKLITPDDVVLELPPGATTTDVEVVTRSLGLTPLEVIVLTPDGRHELARTTIRIRSTAVPGLGLLLTGTALAFLLGWWIVSIGKGRRSQEVDGAGSGEPDTRHSDAATRSRDAAVDDETASPATGAGERSTVVE